MTMLIKKGTRLYFSLSLPRSPIRALHFKTISQR